MENGKYVDGSLWFYAPNKVAPVVFTVLFFISGATHFWQCMHYKCWKVSGILPWSALLFVVGYASREYGAFHYENINNYIVSLVFIYAAPPLYELSNYFVLSRCLYYIPYQSPIHPGRVLTTFGFLSTIVESLNGTGAAYVANASLTQKQHDTGKSLLKTALILQLVILGLFLLLANTFHRKCKKAGILPSNLNAVLLTLYISSTLIGIRTIYRTIEYFTTSSLKFTDDLDPASLSPLLRYEWYFWFFEGTLMIINSYLLNILHPMRRLPRNNKIYLGEDGVTEIEGPGYEDKRKFIVTFLDPFDLMGMWRGRNMTESFWETHTEGRVAGVESASDGAEAEKGKSRFGLIGLVRGK